MTGMALSRIWYIVVFMEALSIVMYPGDPLVMYHFSVIRTASARFLAV
jgi:hypothetical protein